MKKLLLIGFMILLLPSVLAATISSDGFESNSFCGGAGWNTLCWNITGSVAITNNLPYEGTYRCWLRSSTGIMTRQVNTAGYSNVNVTFAVKINSLESTDKAFFKVQTNGGAYTTIKEWNSTHSDNTWKLYSFKLSDYGVNTNGILNITFTGQMSDFGDEFLIDAVSVTGDVGVTPAIILTMNNNYFTGETNVPIILSSTQANTIHTLQLSYSNGTAFCSANILSPAVANTAFSTLCNMPSTSAIDSKAFAYVTNTPSINVTKTFNVIELVQDASKLKIQQVYFSPQVLQGGSTEIFAVITGNVTSSVVILKYPNNLTRTLFLSPTPNLNEYRAFITDTYQVGNVSFTLKTEGSGYYDNYMNYYTVAAYNLNFVDVVNKVSEVAVCKKVEEIPKERIEMHGTEYIYGETSKVWLQLINSSGTDITSGICYLDIYYPDNTKYIERAKMTNMLHDGIYYYDLVLPEIEGVYPTIALCYYTVVITNNYATSYTLINGTLNGGTLGNTNVLDGVYLTTSETPAGAGDPRRYLSEFIFGEGTKICDISSDLLTGITIDWTGRWNSNIGADVMTLSIYNYSSSSWMTLPNAITGVGTGSKTISNSMLFNNISKAGFVNSSGTGLKLRFNDTSLADGSSSSFDYDYLSVSCTQVGGTTWQQVKGSSELHLVNPQGYRFNIQTLLCGEDHPTSEKCAVFQADDTPQGRIIENITFSNPLGRELSQSYTYETAPGIDCTAVYNITKINNITAELTSNYATGTNGNCLISFLVEFYEGEYTQKVNIQMDNYMKWEVIRAYDMRQSLSTIEDICNDYATALNFTYIIPIVNDRVTDYTNDSSLIYCNRVLDDIYFFDDYYNTSESITTVGEYESYYYELAQWYYEALRAEYNAIGIRLIYEQMGVIGDTIWNNPSRNLTYYASTVTAQDIWEYPSRNLTYYSADVNVTIDYNLIANGVWGYLGIIDSSILGQFGVTINQSVEDLKTPRMTIG